MSEQDTLIWNRFIDKFPDIFEQVQYDYHIGNPPAFNTLYDDDTDHNQDLLYRKRIDVIGYDTDTIYICEIKPRARESTIGQVEGYKELYERDHELNKKVEPVIITDEVMLDMEWLCAKKGVKLIIV